MNAQLIKQAEAAPVAVIFKRDPAGNRVAFLKDSQDHSVDGGKISVWHEGKAREVEEVPLSYYHSSKALEHADLLDIQNKFAESYQPKFGIAVKSRLGKDLSKHVTSVNNNDHAKSANSTLRRATDKPVFSFNAEEYKAKMQIAIQAAIAAVDAEYAQK